MCGCNLVTPRLIGGGPRSSSGGAEGEWPRSISVTDIIMPRMDGLSLLQKLQENEKQVSTIIVSAYGDMSNIRTAMNRGAF